MQKILAKIALFIFIFLIVFLSSRKIAAEIILAHSELIIPETPVDLGQRELTFDELVDKYAAKYGQDASLARKIMFAESSHNFYARNDNVKNGEVWSSDWCYWQINDYWNDSLAERHGWDYKNNQEDCMEMGFYMLATQGTQPWSASKYSPNGWGY